MPGSTSRDYGKGTGGRWEPQSPSSLISSGRWPSPEHGRAIQRRGCTRSANACPGCLVRPDRSASGLERDTACPKAAVQVQSGSKAGSGGVPKGTGPRSCVQGCPHNSMVADGSRAPSLLPGKLQVPVPLYHLPWCPGSCPGPLWPTQPWTCISRKKHRFPDLRGNQWHS